MEQHPPSCVHEPWSRNGRTNAYEYARHPSCVHGRTDAYEYAPDNELCVHRRTNAYEYAPENESKLELGFHSQEDLKAIPMEQCDEDVV